MKILTALLFTAHVYCPKSQVTRKKSLANCLNLDVTNYQGCGTQSTNLFCIKESKYIVKQVNISKHAVLLTSNICYIFNAKQKSQPSVSKKSRTTDTLSGILSSFPINFSLKHNAKFGLRELVAILTEMSMSCITAEEAVRMIGHKKGIPSAKWFRNMINTIDPNVSKDICNKILKQTVKVVKDLRLYKGDIIIAIDKHMIPRHDKDTTNLVSAKPKGGTSKFECYGTMQTVACKINAILGCVRLTEDDSNANLVRKFMKNLHNYKIRAKLILLDRGFYSVNVMLAFLELGNKFLMPAIKNIGIKKAILEYHYKNRDAISEYTMKNSLGKMATFTLVIRPSKNKKKKKKSKSNGIIDKYIVFATNLSMEQIAVLDISELAKQYKKRWIIETGYRQLEQVRARTKSRNESYRNLLFFMSVLIYNMWYIERKKTKGTQIIAMKLSEIIFELKTAALQTCLTAGIPYDPGGTDK